MNGLLLIIPLFRQSVAHILPAIFVSLTFNPNEPPGYFYMVVFQPSGSHITGYFCMKFKPNEPPGYSKATPAVYQPMVVG